MGSEEFLLLPLSQLMDILSSDELNVRSEEQVFQAAISWIRYDVAGRKPYLATVSRCSCVFIFN